MRSLPSFACPSEQTTPSRLCRRPLLISYKGVLLTLPRFNFRIYSVDSVAGHSCAKVDSSKQRNLLVNELTTAWHTGADERPPFGTHQPRSADTLLLNSHIQNSPQPALYSARQAVAPSPPS